MQLEILTKVMVTVGAIALLGSSTPARADDTFIDNFDDGWLDTCNWLPATGAGVTIIETGGVLALLSEDGGHTMVSTIHAFVGDFNVEVDFELLEFPATYACNASLRVYSPLSAPPTQNLVAIKRWRDSTRNDYAMLRYVDGDYQEIGDPVATSDASGRFRIQRSGEAFNSYYWSSGEWQFFRSTDHFEGPMVVILDAFGAGTTPPTVSAAFDNLAVTAAGITGDNDFDYDEDVDASDLVVFVDCLAGPEQAADSQCALADTDCDGDVDLRDFAMLQLDFTGSL